MALSGAWNTNGGIIRKLSALAIFAFVVGLAAPMTAVATETAETAATTYSDLEEGAVEPTSERPVWHQSDAESLARDGGG